MCSANNLGGLIAAAKINWGAFASAMDTLLVGEIHCNLEITSSLIAFLDDQPVDHILFSPMEIIGSLGHTNQAVRLGSVALLPGKQRQEIGMALGDQGQEKCWDAGHRPAFALGNASYYPRFGFQPASLFHFKCALDVPEEAFWLLNC